MAEFANPVAIDVNSAENVPAAPGMLPALASDGQSWVLSTPGAALNNGAPPVTVTGAKGANVALGSLIAALVSLGVITDATTA